MKVNVAVEPANLVTFSDMQVSSLFIVVGVTNPRVYVKISTTQAMQLGSEGDAWALDMRAEVMPVYEINVKVQR